MTASPKGRPAARGAAPCAAPKATGGSGHARASGPKPSRRAATERRIGYIAELMRRLEWRTGRSGPELAKKWGLSLSRVEHLAAEASRAVRAEVCDATSVHQTLCTALDRVLRDALADNDRRSVVRASVALARIAGALAPERLQVTTDARERPAMTLAEVVTRIQNAKQALENAHAAGGLDKPSVGLAEPRIGKRVLNGVTGS